MFLRDIREQRAIFKYLQLNYILKKESKAFDATMAAWLRLCFDLVSMVSDCTATTYLVT